MASLGTSEQSNALGRAKELAGRLTPIQKITLGAVLLTVIAGGLVLSRSSDTVAMTALYTDLNSADAAQVVDELSTRGVQYDLADAGRTVMVPKDDVYDLRVALAGVGLPTSNEGYALLDEQGITTSEFRQRIDYQRALEGELAKTLSALDSVQAASVRLALPDESLFVDEPASPTAAVLVTPRGVGTISSNEVEAIVHLVASSVKDMKPEGVTVVDSDGNVLSTGGGTAGGGALGGSTERAKVTAEYEAKMQASIMAMLAKAFGPNKVAVTVTAQLDLNQTSQTAEDFGSTDPDELPFVISNSASREEYGADAAAAGGATGTGNDTGILGPDGALTADDITVDDGTGTPVAGSGYVKEEADTDYAVDRTVTQTTKMPGEVTGLDVAVLVDEATVTEDQRLVIEEMVTAASGADLERGDVVTVKRLTFDTTATAAAEELAKAEEAAAAKSQMMGMVRTIAVLLVILVALILGYRSAKNARKVTATPINIGEITTGPRPSLGPGSAIDPSEIETEAVPIAINRPPDRDAIVMNELTQMADRRPQEVANVLRAWLAENKAGARR